MQTMHIIDAYCGIGPWADRDRLLPATPAETLAILDGCAIGRALVYSNLAHAWADAIDVNQATVRLCAGNPRFVPAFLLAPHPYDDSPKPADYAAAMRAAGARAAWLRPASQQHGLAPWQIGGLLDMCAECRLPLFLPADSGTPEQLDLLGHEFPRLRLVLANLSYRDDNWLYPLLRRHAAFCACLGPTYVPPLGPERFVRHFGTARLIFGSGLPHHAPGGLIGHVMYARIPEAAKQAVLGGNLERLMQEVCL